ncbi:MAG: IS1 family transposase [Nitrospira sp.]|nr:IS1 family transposase [Nitrospira sp.]
MNKLSTTKRTQVIAALVEGAGVNSVSRMTGVGKPTILRLLENLGKACQEFQDRTLRNLTCQRIQVDEIWSFCFGKDKNLPDELKGKFGFGSVWTWMAIDADTKLIPSWLVGGRDASYAEKFISDLSGRLTHRVQLTSDGHRPYLEAIQNAFGCEIDYAMLIKLYNNPPTGNQTRYSPGVCCGTRKTRITGDPDKKHVSTSYSERLNLQLRMSNRRFTRLTNAHSKKIDNHIYSMAIYTMYYNFVRIHSSLRVTPAMEAGVSQHVWSLEEMIGLLDD